MIMTRLMVGLVVAGIVLVILGLIGSRRAQMEDYAYLTPIFGGAILIVIAALLWCGRWLWHLAELLL